MGSRTISAFMWGSCIGSSMLLVCMEPHNYAIMIRRGLTFMPCALTTL